MTLSLIKLCKECHHSEYRVLFIIMLKVVMVSVIGLSVAMQDVVPLNVVRLNGNIRNIEAPIFFPQNVSLWSSWLLGEQLGDLRFKSKVTENKI